MEKTDSLVPCCSIMNRMNLGLPEHFRVEWMSIVGSTSWLATRQHLSNEDLQRFYDEPGLDVSSELEIATEDVWHHTLEDQAQWELGNQPVLPSISNEEQPWDSPGQQPQQLQDPLEQQPQQPPLSAEPEEWPHKFQPGSDWVMVTGSDVSPREMLPYCTLAEYDKLDKELGKEKVKDLLGNYFEETIAMVQDLISENPSITGSEATKAMEVDPQEAEPAAEVQDQPMETE